ncbi:oxidoreductase [Pedobacter sp. SYSU D00535]|uniref:oxidoreductase n=1 Tax=Pedobacter sp. SYSU D00535 TaxID=2810308 RepID=UPI001A9700A4|nr:oxidoreductase [Pedobacter sp. SYSU D00535]
MENKERIWFITGVSGGLGRALAQEVAAAGDIVIGSLRKEEQREAFEKLLPGKTFGVLLDVNDQSQISSVVEDAVARFGRIDVLVNNAGYGLFGAIEEVSMEEARQQMETNFFGPLALTQAVLPHMRNKKNGCIVQISSQAGFRSNPGMGLYNASKFALEGFSEALALETAELGIKVIIVEPGPFRTSWAGDSSKTAETKIDAYTSTAGALTETIKGYAGKQPNDPAKGARAIITAVNSENPPLRLPLGKEAIEAIRRKLKSVEENVNSWEDVAADTAF